jgi:hypothetical protein
LINAGYPHRRAGIGFSYSLFDLHLPQILHVYPKKWAIRENWTMRLVSGIWERPICTCIILGWFENFLQVNSTYILICSSIVPGKYILDTPSVGALTFPPGKSLVDFHTHLQDCVMKFNQIYPTTVSKSNEFYPPCGRSPTTSGISPTTSGRSPTCFFSVLKVT